MKKETYQNILFLLGLLSVIFGFFLALMALVYVSLDKSTAEKYQPHYVYMILMIVISAVLVIGGGKLSYYLWNKRFPS